MEISNKNTNDTMKAMFEIITEDVKDIYTKPYLKNAIISHMNQFINEYDKVAKFVHSLPWIDIVTHTA